MANAAAAQGIPPSAIFVETKATDTIQNACYSARLMREHGWRSAEIVSSAYHLPRASLIFGRTGLEWRMRAAPSLQQGESGSDGVSGIELLKTMRFLVYTSWAERCE
jgi:vancomycin permeability regulator SanA